MKKSIIAVLFLSLIVVGASRFEVTYVRDIVSGINLKLANWGGIYTTSFLLEVAQGNVEGYSLITKFGENPDVDQAAPETIWDNDGLYTWAPNSGESLEVLSSLAADAGATLFDDVATGGSLVTLIDTKQNFSATAAVGDLLINDTNDEFGIITAVVGDTITCAAMNNGSQENFHSTANETGDEYRVATAASTGLATGVIHGIDGDGLFANEIFVLNGINEVPLKRTYMGTHRMAGITADTPAGSIGDITCERVSDQLITAQMLAGNNKTLMAVFRTPSDKICYFLKGYVGITKSGPLAQTNTARFTWRVLPFMSVQSVNGVMEIISTGSSTWQYTYEAIPGIPPLTLIDIRCDLVNQDGTGVVGGMGILIVDIGS